MNWKGINVKGLELFGLGCYYKDSRAMRFHAPLLCFLYDRKIAEIDIRIGI